MTRHREYVLITAARNEAAYIARTIESVCMQTIRPSKWVIVSDGSTDETDEIIKKYAVKHNFIFFQRRECGCNRPDFASKAFALEDGYRWLQGLEYHYIGILDADITFEATYYEEVLKRFYTNTRLGICGGFVYEKINGLFKSRPTNSTRSVAGGIQFFQRECYEKIGGIMPSKSGGEDWMAEISARMAGWEVAAFPELAVHHHKPGSSVRGTARECIRQGKMDYAIGSHPLFEIFKCVRRVKVKPFFIGSILRIFGYAHAWASGEKRVMLPEAMAFLRAEQLNRIKHSLQDSRIWRLL
ncbi:MAG: glycosyltransferase family A protein [Actinomycetota bacterium]|nr:glycosyltransferase family A protein [Nitrospiraceae bacterium]MDA8155554.1 glycosyltransferase family A protein [Actinomycetota bacterium]